MKKILFITAFPPSNIGAGVNYTRQLLNELSSFINVDLIYFYSNEEVKELSPNINTLYKFRINRFFKLFSVLKLPVLFPLFTAKFSFHKLKIIKEFIKKKKYNYIYFDFSQTFLYNKYIDHNNKILMCHDVIAQRYFRENKFFGFWAKLSEKWILQGNATIFTFSEKDSLLLSNWYKKSSIPTNFYFSQNVINTFPKLIENYFVFFAMWQRPDNYLGLKWFIEKILPFFPDKKFKIIGAKLPPYIIQLLKLHKNIEYLGFIDDPYSIISNSQALISPLFKGAGIKVKVLDSLAVGCPVIGTDISFEGISNNYKELIFMANTTLEFIRIIKKINVPIETRLRIKELFINDIKKRNIISYLKK